MKFGFTNSLLNCPGTNRCAIFLFIALFLFSSLIKSQQTDSTLFYIDESNKIFNSNIKTVLFHPQDWELSPPILKFGSDEKLKLSFDDLDADKKDYFFTIVHCDAGWKPSLLQQNEYINGYFEDEITDYEFSVNTLIAFTHYELIFPTDNLIPKLSGNYVLKVYSGGPNSIYFTRRFLITDNQVTVDGKVGQASRNEDRYYKQEIDFTINTGDLRFMNAYRDLKVVITQNGRWDNAIRNIKPKMIVGEKLDFDYESENVFNGGNEFHSFDIKSLKYNTENIAHIDKEPSVYDVYLRPIERRTFIVYKQQDDIDGMMKIKTEDKDITETQAEYVNVHFSLSYAAPMIDGNMYIIGQLTDWRYSDDSKMDYNYKQKQYEKTILLKQGYYNYQFILLYFGQPTGDETLIEGNHSETGNTYTIYSYYSDPGLNYDQLVGVRHFSSVIDK
jgi:hypothetical protein